MTQEQRPAMGRSGDPKYTWEDTVAAIGQDFSAGEEHLADETIAPFSVVRYCEVWEIGNPLYWQEDVAKQAGYKGVVAPWSSIKQTFSYGGAWRPGQATRFPSTMGKDESIRFGSYQPEGKPIPKPPTTQGLNTGMEIEFFEPVHVGDHLTVKGKKLVEVRPRQTRIGYGAFTLTESTIYNQHGQLVARTKEGGYAYNPNPPEPSPQR